MLPGAPPPEAAITFAIPFYTGGEYLRCAVESVLRQTRPDWELLVCDDAGPEPGTEALLRSFADARVRYVRNEANLGMIGNWNQCLDLARTDLVTLLHADDALLPGYADLMVKAAAGHPRAAAFFCAARIIDA